MTLCALIDTDEQGARTSVRLFDLAVVALWRGNPWIGFGGAGGRCEAAG